MPGMSFCRADETDIPVIYGLCKDLIDRYEDRQAIDYEKVLQWVQQKIRDNISDYTCVRTDNEKVAYYCMGFHDGQWELDDLYVLAPFRNRGIGEQIVRKCISVADAPLFLYVFNENHGAIRLYERLGFVKTKSVGKTRSIMYWQG